MQTLLSHLCGKRQPGPWAGAAAAAGNTQHPSTGVDYASQSQMPDLWHTRTADAGVMWSSAWSLTSM